MLAVAEGNHFGWTFDTALTVVFIGACGMIAWIKTARHGDSKAVDVALVSTTSALADTAASTDKQFEGVRDEIKVLAKAVAEGLSGLNTALKLIAGLAAIASVVAVVFFQ
jgi:hypothetical protein